MRAVAFCDKINHQSLVRGRKKKILHRSPVLPSLLRASHWPTQLEFRPVPQESEYKWIKYGNGSKGGRWKIPSVLRNGRVCRRQRWGRQFFLVPSKPFKGHFFLVQGWPRTTTEVHHYPGLLPWLPMVPTGPLHRPVFLESQSIFQMGTVLTFPLYIFLHSNPSKQATPC